MEKFQQHCERAGNVKENQDFRGICGENPSQTNSNVQKTTKQGQNYGRKKKSPRLCSTFVLWIFKNTKRTTLRSEREGDNNLCPLLLSSSVPLRYSFVFDKFRSSFCANFYRNFSSLSLVRLAKHQQQNNE